MTDKIDDLMDESIIVNSDDIKYELKKMNIKSIFNSKILLQPNFQRGFVWDRKKASRLIESILVGIPLPTIYLMESEDGGYEVIDGQQRLTSIISFVKSVFPNSRLPFKLTLEKSNYDKKCYNELTEEEQNKIKETELSVTIIKKESKKDAKYELFERLNTGSASLNGMEIRNAMFAGKHLDFLKTLTKNEFFLETTNSKTLEKRMKDLELVIMFFAFQELNGDIERYSKPKKVFLNLYLEQYKNDKISDEKIKELENIFIETHKIIYKIFGEKSFRKYTKNEDGTGSYVKNLNISLYAIYASYFGKHIDKIDWFNKNSEIVRSEIENMMFNNMDFQSGDFNGADPKVMAKKYNAIKNVLDNLLSR